MPGYAEPDSTEEQHILYVMACGFGVFFLDCLEKSSLRDSDKVFSVGKVPQVHFSLYQKRAEATSYEPGTSE